MHLKSDSVTLRKLCDEKVRLDTFDKWPVKFITKEALAKNGFYYKGVNDSVICIFCGVEIGFWEEGDDPVEEHRKFSPNCGIFAPQIDARMQRPARGEDQCGCLIRPQKKERDLRTLEARFYTFKDWPISMKQTPKEMAQAGFYYSGKGDKVICFSCGLGLNKWQPNDNPWIEHAKWNPVCEFLIETKGESFIKKVIENTVSKAEEQSLNFETSSPSSVHEQLLCSVCKCEQRTIVSMPCRHLATCKLCNEKLMKCPICRTEEKEALQVILP